MTTENTETTNRLEALAKMTQETEQANPSAESQQEDQKKVEQASAAEQGAREWAMLMFTVGGFACMIAPELKPVYSQERCLDWGSNANMVGAKYGWNGLGNMPELALIASTISFALPTWMLVSAKLRDLKAGKDGTWLEKVGAWLRNRKGSKAAVQPEQAGDANGSK